MNTGGRGNVACTVDLHEQMLWQVRRGRSIDTAAALLGMSGRSVHRCARRDQLFREQLSQALAARQGSTLPHGRDQVPAGACGPRWRSRLDTACSGSPRRRVQRRADAAGIEATA